MLNAKILHSGWSVQIICNSIACLGRACDSNCLFVFLCPFCSCRATLIPTSAVLGVAGGPLWSAKCTYLAMTGHLQAQREGKGSGRAKDLLTQYFGIFFAMFQTSAVWGNLLSSLVFSQDMHVGKSHTSDPFSSTWLVLTIHTTLKTRGSDTAQI